MMNLRSGGIRTCRLKNAFFHEGFTCESSYLKKLLKNTFMYGDYTLPPELPILHMKPDMESYAVDVENDLPPVGVSAEPLMVATKRSDDHFPSTSGRILRDDAVANTNDSEAFALDTCSKKRKRKPGLMLSRNDTVVATDHDNAELQAASTSFDPARRQRRPNI